MDKTGRQMQEACVDQGSEKIASVIEEAWWGLQTDEPHGRTAVSEQAGKLASESASSFWRIWFCCQTKLNWQQNTGTNSEEVIRGYKGAQQDSFCFKKKNSYVAISVRKTFVC